MDDKQLNRIADALIDLAHAVRGREELRPDMPPIPSYQTALRWALGQLPPLPKDSYAVVYIGILQKHEQEMIESAVKFVQKSSGKQMTCCFWTPQ